MKRSERQQIFSQNVARLIAYAWAALDIGVTFGEAWRSKDQQILYYYGLTFDDQIRLEQTRKRSWTMDSQHHKRLAIDLNHFINGGKDLTWRKEDLQALGDYWESLHEDNRWGGNFPSHQLDVPHYEMQD